MDVRLRVLAYALLFLDTGADTLSQHWPDAALTALLAFCLWLIQRWISGLEKRHERAENEFVKLRAEISCRDRDIAVLQVEIKMGEHIDHMALAITTLAKAIERRDHWETSERDRRRT